MAAPLGLKVELDLAGWTDITQYVYDRDQLSIARGKSSESANAEPSRCTFTVNNRDGRFSPRNPLSPYYGVIGRNTPTRVSLPYGASYLTMTGDEIDGAVTADAAVLDVTGDIDIRIEVTLESWRTDQDLVGKYSPTGNNRSWALVLNASGTLSLIWSPDGTLASRVIATSTVPVPITSGRLAVRAALDVNNGGGGWTAFFGTSASIGGTYTDLGGFPNSGPTTSIVNSNADIELGSILGLTSAAAFGKIHAFELRSGIGGTLVANPNFAIQPAGTTAFNDTTASPRTWLCFSAVDDRDYRFHGEVSAWPQKWDKSGRDVYVPVEAGGILRRLGQGVSPLQSTMYQGLTAITGANKPVAYWPCEDGENSTQIASAIPGAPAMTVHLEQPDYEDYSGFACSKPLPAVQNSVWEGTVPAYTPGNTAQVRFLFHISAGGNGERIFTVYTSGSLRRFALFYGTGGTMTLIAYDSAETQIATSGAVPFAVDGKDLRVSIQLTQVGADVQFTVVVLQVGQNLGSFINTTAAGQTFGRILRVGTNAGGGLASGSEFAAFGHISVHNSITSIFDLADQLKAYAGEKAAARMTRLCDEAGIPYSQIGLTADSELMGPQGVKTFVELVTECAAADLGMLYEPRNRLGLRYRTRAALYNQTPTLELAYANHELADTLNPIDDDQNTRNDVTVSRSSGSSARRTLDTGVLSTQDPPLGVGRYDDSVTLNLENDSRLIDQAGWRLHLGTVDEARYPAISLNLRHSTFANAAKLLGAQSLDVGLRLIVSDLPSFLPPEDVSQLVLGYSEVITGHERTLILNCVPESPWEIATASGLGDTRSRVGSDGSTLRNSINSSATSMVVDTATGPLWTSSTSEMPFSIMVGGEVMAVTGISDPDGTFESGVARWTGFDCTLAQSATRSRYGTYSGLATVINSPGQAYFRPTNGGYVTPGSSYSVEFWAYSVAGYSSITAAIDWSDISGSYLSGAYVTAALPAATWTRFTVRGTAPANAYFAGYGPSIGANPPNGTAVYFDEVLFTRSEAQIFTVTRSANGIVKSHSARSEVRLLKPAIVAL